MNGHIDINPDELLSEKDVIEKYGGLIPAHELKSATKNKEIGCVNMSTKRRFYRLQDISDYLRRFYEPCQKMNPPSDTEDNGSDKKQAPPTGTGTGMSQEQTKSAADHLKLVISEKPKKDL